MTVHIVYDDAVGDPLVDVLKATPIDGIESIALSAFLTKAGVFVDQSEGRLQFSDVSTHQIARIINRVVEISSKTIKALAGPAPLIHRGQVFSAYEKVILESERLDSERQYTALGKLLPLPTQWSLISKHFPEIGIPVFRYGYGPEKIDASELSSPIFKSPSDLYSWRPNERAEGLTWDEFVVSRPSGIPIISFMLKDDVIVESLDGSECIPATRAKIEAYTKSICHLFCARFGEILWFSPSDSLIFASFSFFLAGAAKSGKFNEQATIYMKSYLTY